MQLVTAFSADVEVRLAVTNRGSPVSGLSSSQNLFKCRFDHSSMECVLYRDHRSLIRVTRNQQLSDAEFTLHFTTRLDTSANDLVCLVATMGYTNRTYDNSWQREDRGGVHVSLKDIGTSTEIEFTKGCSASWSSRMELLGDLVPIYKMLVSHCGCESDFEYCAALCNSISNRGYGDQPGSSWSTRI